MNIAVTPVYAGLLVLLLIFLSARVITYRRGNQLSVGDEGDRMLLKRMRVQANSAEYIPAGILLLLLCELIGTPPLALHILGLMMLVGRISHAWGMSSHPQDYRFRSVGMILTLSMLSLSSIGLILHALF